MKINNNRKKITKKKWNDFVKINNTNSYSLAIPFAILYLWEDNVKTRKEAEDSIKRLRLGLSGFQAVNVIDFVLKYDAINILDK